MLSSPRHQPCSPQTPMGSRDCAELRLVVRGHNRGQGRSAVGSQARRPHTCGLLGDADVGEGTTPSPSRQQVELVSTPSPSHSPPFLSFRTRLPLLSPPVPFTSSPPITSCLCPYVDMLGCPRFTQTASDAVVVDIAFPPSLIDPPPALPTPTTSPLTLTHPHASVRLPQPTRTHAYLPFCGCSLPMYIR